MSALGDLLRGSTELGDAVVDHLQNLLSEWQLLADLSFADLLLFVRVSTPDGYLCAAQMRPYTAQTIYLDDLVGEVFGMLDRPIVGRAFAEGRVIRDADPDWSTGVPVREEAIPVRFDDDIVAVITREANVSTARSPSQLELTYLQAASQLARMLADGSFPYRRGDRPEDHELSPRVGDGLMCIDAEGRISYASPNAVSAYRRLGRMDQLIGAPIVQVDPLGEEVGRVFADGTPLIDEIEGEGAVVLRRIMPFVEAGRPSGALLLVREVTELRRHQRALRVKDATIREIHHRVKNNLQTVASLLRLQGRRSPSDECRDALAESVRRISSIALVHETLSREAGETVTFEQIATRIIEMLSDGLLNPDVPIDFQMEGSPGELAAEVATPLALVLTELLQNCVEHAFPGDGVAGRDGSLEPGGTVVVAFQRAVSTLQVTVADDGVGLPPGRSLDDLAHLGLQIARTLITSELGGTFEALPTQRGTTIELVIPLPG